MTVWSELSHIILKLGGYTLDQISEKVLRGLCNIRMPRHFEPGLVVASDVPRRYLSPQNLTDLFPLFHLFRQTIAGSERSMVVFCYRRKFPIVLCFCFFGFFFHFKCHSEVEEGSGGAHCLGLGEGGCRKLRRENHFYVCSFGY